MRLILIRHGQTDSNQVGALDTALPGSPLNANGWEQSSLLPAHLAGEEVTSMWVSPLLRARQTAEALEGDLGITANVREGLREVLAGELEMSTHPRDIACYLDTTRSWMVGRSAVRIPGGEDGESTFRRFDDVIREAAAQTPAQGTLVVVAHGTILRLWTAVGTRGADPAWIAEHPLANTGTALVEGSPESGWHLTSWNDGEWATEPTS